RVGGDVEAEGLLFEFEDFLLRRFLDRLSQREYRSVAALAEEPDLIAGGVTLGLLRDLERVLDQGEQGGARHAGETHRTAFDERFEDAAIDDLGADAHTEVGEVFEVAAGLAHRDNLFGGFLADAANRAEAEAD